MSDLYHRRTERREIRHLLSQGSSILMLAPRRVGKTWIMRRVEEDLSAENWNTIFCDVEGIADESEFLKHLCEQIQSEDLFATHAAGHLKQRLKQILSDGGWATIQEAIGKVNWKSFSDTLINSLNSQERPTVILIDELSLFVMARLRQNPEIALDFLYHLRGLRQRYPKVRWLFTGSVGLDVIARRATLSGALLGLTPFSVEPFTPAEARAFVNDLCNNCRALRPFDFSDESFDYFAGELGWLAPYYLEQIANVFRPSGPLGVNNRPTVTIDNVDAAFAALLSPQHRIHFAAWEEHLTKNFEPPDESKLRALLSMCAKSAKGEKLSTLQAAMSPAQSRLTTRELQDLLSVLINDGFLTEERGRYRFRSGLVRKYWLKYHVD